MTSLKKLIIKILNLKLNILLEYENYKSIFAKGYTSNWSEEVFVIRKVKNTVVWIYVTSDLNGEKLLECFKKNNCKKEIKKVWVEKVITRIGDKLNVKWKNYNNYFNSWIYRKNIV